MCQWQFDKNPTTDTQTLQKHSLTLWRTHGQRQGHRCAKHSLQHLTRKPRWRKGYARQRHHYKMAASRHLRYYQTANSTIRSTDPENPCPEQDMEWIRRTVCEISAFKLHCDLETGVRDHTRSSKVALFDRAHTTLYSSSIVTMPLDRYSRILVENC